MLDGKCLGGILLIVGTSIGGGMLALPVANATAGFAVSSLYLFLCWMLMTASAFLVLEVNLALPSGSNMISMAKATLGRSGEVIAWLSYCLLLYCLLSVYISGGADVLQSAVALMGVTLPISLCAGLFVVLLGLVVIRGIYSVDSVNRLLMFSKLGVYAIVMLLIARHLQPHLLIQATPAWAVSSWMVLVTSFGFAIIVPSLRTYFNDDVKKLRLALTIGSLIPLICYVLWDLFIMGIIPQSGDHGLLNMLTTGHETTALTAALSSQLQSQMITGLFRSFTIICMLTAFLGVALALVDFLADGLQLQKKGGEGILIYVLTFIPSLVIVLFYPNLFIKGLSYAGICCIVLLMLLPAMMAWSGRYVTNIIDTPQIRGGRWSLALLMIAGISLLLIGIVSTI